uniref:EamA domain-containing protein n=1 Tax=Chromera velia CCMP2878 TaxID=1169474 RepID=A0A0G4I7K5_9ALVE|eukprot:Cvel_11688.t1-p1 / transcript=Cvel_11688.t1 / gene=Cvel_11688 / organism=Chromera_velia_CCMP2878 / gene_product=hypothetical protein / transcript_product=hypothetical protein / location=Cvel_scaffold741:14116-18549(+) / protein_length=371 / sequence_SO=supercontig / SO=protein_coding / is_pseudo=false
MEARAIEVAKGRVFGFPLLPHLGTQHSIIKIAETETGGGGGPSPALLNFCRFLVASVFFTPWLPSPTAGDGRDGETVSSPVGWEGGKGTENEGEGSEKGPLAGLFQRAPPELGPSTWRAGVELGFWMFLGYALQAVGLETTSASRSAFLLYLNVKFVPFFARVLLGRDISLATWVSALLAVAGTFLLSNDGSPPVEGDLWSIAAAAASAIFILRLEGAAGKFPAAALNAASLFAVAGFCGVWLVADTFREAWRDGAGMPKLGVQLERWKGELSGPGRETAGEAVVYLGVVTTALSNFIQTVGQRRVPAETAALIFATDPVWAALFAYLWLGETLGAQGLAGAALILGAAVSQQVGLLGSGNPKEDSERQVE